MEHESMRKLASAIGSIGVATADGGVGFNGDLDVDGDSIIAFVASVDLSPSVEAVHGILSLQTSSVFLDAVDIQTDSLVLMEPGIIQASCLTALMSSWPCVLDLAKAPSSYLEAITYPDAPA